MHAEELVAIVEILPVEGLVYGVSRVVELDEDMLVVGLVIGAAGAKHDAELGPVLDRARPLGESHGRTMHAHQPAAAVHEFQQALSQGGVFEAVAHRVVEEDRIELPEALGFEDGGVSADDRLESARSLAHQRESQIRGGDGAMPAVADVQVKNEKPAALARRREGLGRQRRLDFLSLFRVRRGLHLCQSVGRQHAGGSRRTAEKLAPGDSLSHCQESPNETHFTDVCVAGILPAIRGRDALESVHSTPTRWMFHYNVLKVSRPVSSRHVSAGRGPP